jgi:ABC-type transport system involved in multi-copper enzyme maturation permease subunit
MSEKIIAPDVRWPYDGGGMAWAENLAGRGSPFRRGRAARGPEAMRWGLGPVFFYECLANSRRWQTYAIRSAGVALLLAAIATIAMPNTTIAPRYALQEFAALGESFFYCLIGVELTLVMLAAPAATAGAICVDRARGMLAHMLATDLSDPEIVLGKLAARLLPVLGLVACSWPVLALSSLLGGIDPLALALAFAIILAVALLGCSMAMALSVWARKPHEVVLVVYTFWALVLLISPIWYALAWLKLVGPPADWSLLANPYYLAFAPYSAPGRVDLWDYLAFFAATLGAAVALAVLAIWRMRPVARRGTNENRKRCRLGWVGRLARRLPGPALDGNPVLWREWHRSRPSRWTTILGVLVGGSTGAACTFGAVSALIGGLDESASAVPLELIVRLWPVWLIVGAYGAILQLIFGLLMISAAAPTSMAEERQRGSLDLLVATTLSTPTIVLGKWLATLRQVALLAIGPGLLGLGLALAVKAPQTFPAWLPARYHGELSDGALLFGACLLIMTILAHGALIASIGLALAVWIARQSRAIGLSVGLAVIVGAGWPILVFSKGPGAAREGMAYLSPVVAVLELIQVIIQRRRDGSIALWWITFWDIECLALAVGLLWLTVRTFHRPFDRVPDRSGRAPVLADVVMVLAGLIGIGSLLGGIGVWVQGTSDFMPTALLGVLACIVAVAVGFALLAALAASSMSPAARSPARAPGSAAAISDRKSFAIRWWEAFRLVPLLAIGPALVALAMATAPTAFRVATTVKPLPSGGSVSIQTDGEGETYVTTTDASGRRTYHPATDAEIAEAGPAPTQTRGALLQFAALATVTVLAHGAAFVSLGAALGVWIRRRSRAIAASVGLVLFVTVAWPFVFLNIFGDPYDPRWGLALASVLLAFLSVLFGPYTERPEMLANATGSVVYWDVILMLSAAVFSGLAIRTLSRRSRREPPAE